VPQFQSPLFTQKERSAAEDMEEFNHKHEPLQLREESAISIQFGQRLTDITS